MQNTQEENQDGGFLERKIGLLEKGCTFMASFALVMMIAIIAVGALSRYFFNHPFSFVDEYSGYLLVAMGFLAMASALRRNAHITVDIITKALPEKSRLWFDVGSHCIGILIAGVLFWISLKLCYENYSTHTLSSTIMETPLWIPQLFIPLGWAAFILLAVVRVKERLKGGKGVDKPMIKNIKSGRPEA